MTRNYSAEAATMAAAIRELAKHPDDLDNLENYLSCHFEVWLKRYAYTPTDLAAEFASFAHIDSGEVKP